MTETGKIKNPALKAQWLKDLRSGNLKQCSGALCEKGSKNKKASYCCLGVLGRSIQKIKAFPIEYINGRIRYKGECEYGQLPTELREEIGIPDQVETVLIHMNDDEQKSFKEIADFIEKNL
jgi:hypothetical protein